MHHKRNSATNTLNAEGKLQTESQALLAVNSKYVNGFTIEKHNYRLYEKAYSYQQFFHSLNVYYI